MGADLEWTTPCTSSDLLHPSAIEPLLRTRLLGKRGIHYYEDLGSTNDRARELALEGCPQGVVVVAEAQTSGRGRLGRTWASPAGLGLYMSVILRPPFPISEAPRITLLAGVAVCQAIIDLAPVDPRIKWPNDVLVGGRKVAGVLTEMETDRNSIRHVVVGVGINVNTPASAFPPELKETATSLLQGLGRPVSRQGLFLALMEEMETLWDDLLGSGFERLREKWRYLSATLGRRVRVEASGCRRMGHAVDIDDSGALLVRAENGSLHRIQSGEVTLLRPEPEVT